VTEWHRLRRGATQPQDHRELTDASPVAEPSRRVEIDPELRRKLKLRRRALVLGLAGICVAGSLATLFGDRGYLDSRRYRVQIDALEHQLKERRVQVSDLRLRAERLDNDPAARERIAREELGLVAPGEMEFLLPRSASADWAKEPVRGAP
jgi:cell division protein FtsB